MFCNASSRHQSNKKKFQARNRDLDEEFRLYVKEFVEHIANPRNLEPKRSSTKAITPREMLNMITACDTIFADRMVDAQNMMKMNEKAYYSSLCQESVMTYDNIMKENVHNEIDATALQQMHVNCKQQTVQRLKDAEFVGGDDSHNWKEHFLEHFSTQCDDHFVNTMRDYENRMQKTELQTTKAFLDYESRMKRELFKPLSDEELEIVHVKHQNAVAEMYAGSADMNSLINHMAGVYENFKEENRFRREALKREQAERQREEERLNREIERLEEGREEFNELRAAFQQQMRDHQQAVERENAMKKLINRLINVSLRNWNEFLATYPDDVAMQRKRNEISSNLSSEFFKEAGQESTAEHEQLLRELQRHYEDAKRGNDLRWELEKKEIENAVTSEILKIKDEYNKRMVDCHINEEMIKKSFETIRGITPEDRVGARSERSKRYFKETLNKECDKAMDEILE